MRDVVYFDGHGATDRLLVLGIYATLGTIGAIIMGRLRAPAGPTSAS
jgi:hypothetical protein